MTALAGQKITKLEIEKFKRIAAAVIEIDENDNLVVLRGENGAGKSTIIDAIESAIAGAAASPPMPIREGETVARVVVTTTDLVISRRWTHGPKGITTDLEVRARDGKKLPSPQKVLDALYDELAFNALEFESMKPKEQLELLKKLVGIDTAPLDRQRQQIYDARTLVTRELDAATARLKAMPTGKPPRSSTPRPC